MCRSTPSVFAEHAARVADAAAAVDAEADRQRMEQLAVGLRVARLAEIEHLPHVGGADLAPAGVDRDRDLLGGRPAAADADENALDDAAGHALGRVHGGGHGSARAFDVDDGARAHALARLMADADHGRPAVLSTLARKHAVLLVPRSSTATMSRRGFPFFCRSWTSAHPAFLGFLAAPGFSGGAGAAAGVAVRGLRITRRSGRRMS